MCTMSQVKNTNKMFKGCKKLKILDLSFINTYQVTNMDYIFNEYSELQILNIPNFNMTSVKSMNYIFSGCQNLLYVNIYSASSKTNLNNQFKNFSENLTYCINEKEDDIISILDLKYGINDCPNICHFLNLKKLINNSNKCFTNCIHDELYQFEYNNKCYYECPEGTMALLKDNLCVKINKEQLFQQEIKKIQQFPLNLKEKL